MGSHKAAEVLRNPRLWVTVVLAGIGLSAAVVGVAVAKGSSDPIEVTVSSATTEHARDGAAMPARTTVTFDTRGDTIDLVDGWYLADRPMAPELVNPRELFSIATFPLEVPVTRAVCVGNAPPASPVAVMGPDDVYLWLVEWYPTDSRMPSVETSSRRPDHFVLHEKNGRQCVQAASPHVRGGSFSFTDRGRVFSLYYVVGTNVTGARAHLVEEVLDSIAFVD